MIQIVVTNGVPYIWNPEGWREARTVHGIIGSFDGAEGEGWTNEIHANLPFKLTQHEARYLVNKGGAQAVWAPSLKEFKPPVDEIKMLERCGELEKESLEAYRKRKRSELESTVDKIIEGKKRKGRPVGDREVVIQQELEKYKVFPYVATRFDLRDPWITESDLIPYDFPSHPSALETLRYRVFEDMRSNLKYYLTTGIKFGGDFIAYKGDPLMYHAEYIIMCEVTNRKFTDTHILSQCRLASTLKKKLLIASVDDNDHLIYKLVYRTSPANVVQRETELLLNESNNI